MGNNSSSASTPVSIHILHVPFQVLLSFLRIFRWLFIFSKWTCGLQGNQTTCLCPVTAQHVLAGSSAAAQGLPVCPVMSSTQIFVFTAPRLLCSQHRDCCVHSGQYLRLQNQLTVRKKYLQNLMLLSFTPQHFAGLRFLVRTSSSLH